MNDEPDTLDEVLDEVEQRVGDERTAPPEMTLGELLGAVGRQSYGPLLLIIGLFAISPATIVPGMTWFAAGLTLLVAGQMALGLKHMWLPRWLLRVRAPRALVGQGVRDARGWSGRIDGLLRPRLEFLSKPPFVNIVALLCIGAALITFPLGLIPFAPLAPGLAVVFFGLGMVGRDGLWLLLGTAAVAGAFWLAAPLLL
ncbi:MAG: exopolysaccharide biosynthesis protein [Hyphomonadaceae bacterium]|nr:exopolysaccharide biosynthesis protein [Hyphomonadaceae bacterium]